MENIKLKQFPEKYLDLPSGSSAGFIPVSRKGDGRLFRIDTIRLALELGFGGANFSQIFFSGNALPSLNNEGNALEKGDWGFLSAGQTYTNVGGGSDIIVPEDVFSIAVFDGVKWVYKELSRLSDNSSTIENYVEGSYKAFSVKKRNGVIYRSLRRTSEVPSLNAVDWEILFPSYDIESNVYLNKGYVEKGNGSIIPDNSLESSVYLHIIKGQDVVITGYSGLNDAAGLIGFYDENHKFISSKNANTQGWVAKFTIPSSEIPLNAVWARVTKHNSQIPYISGLDVLFRPSSYQEFSLRRLDNLNNQLNSVSTRNMIDYFSGSGYVEKGNGSIIPDNDLKHSIFLKLDNVNNLVVTGYSGLNDAAGLVVFYDKNYNYLGHKNAPTAGAVDRFVIPVSEYPANSVYIRATRRGVQLPFISGVVSYMTDFEIQNYVNNSISKLNYVDSRKNYFSTVGYVNKTNGEVVYQTDFVSTRFLRINKTLDLVVSGYSGRDDFASLISFYDRDFNFIKSVNASSQGIVNNFVFKKEDYPLDAFYMKATSTSAHTTRKVEGLDISLDVNDIYSYTGSTKRSLIEKIETSSVPFEDTVKIRNYLGNYQNIHPKVLFFQNGLWGYKYWMGYTPFPNEWDQYENPCIAVSNDGVNWTVPVGLKNPLAFAPANGYNSDTHLVYREDTKTLECWYRPYDNSTTSAKLVRRTTLDGINWTPQETIQGIEGVLSPSIIFEDGKYKVWFPNSTKTIYYTESSGASPTGWTIPSGRLINVFAWHMDVIRTNKGLEYLIQGWNEGEGDNFQSSMFYMLESNGVLSEAVKILSIKNLPANPEYYLGLYRGSILFANNEYSVYYSYIRKDRYQGMVLAKGTDIYRLLPYNRDMSTESEVTLIDKDGIFNDFYVHSANTIHIKDSSVTLNSLTGMKPNSIITVALSGDSSLSINDSERISGSINLSSGFVKLLCLDSRNAIII